MSSKLNVAKSHSLFNNSLNFRGESLLAFSCPFCSLFCPCLCEHPTAPCNPINCSFLHCDSQLLRGESCTMFASTVVKFTSNFPCCGLCEWRTTHGGRFLFLSFGWKEVCFWVRSWNEKLLCNGSSGRAHWNISLVSRNMQSYSAVTKWEDSKSLAQHFSTELK